MSPTQLSLRHLRKLGYTCDIVERFIAPIKIRKDLFGCFDIVAIHPNFTGVLGVQTTTRANLPARVKKLKASQNLRLWLRTGNRATCHGWSQKGRRKIYCITEREL